jgi:hypothetical protein
MSTKIERVQPGSLITAEKMNQIIDAINAFQPAAVESMALEILGTVPFPYVHVGEALRVYGKNFGASKGTLSVFIDSMRITEFKKATDTEIAFDVPAIPDVPATGRLTVLAMTNLETDGTKAIHVLPKVVSEEAPSLSVAYLNYDGEIKPNATARFRYKIESQTNRSLTIKVEPNLRFDDWRETEALPVGVTLDQLLESKKFERLEKLKTTQPILDLGNRVTVLNAKDEPISNNTITLAPKESIVVKLSVSFGATWERTAFSIGADVVCESKRFSSATNDFIVGLDVVESADIQIEFSSFHNGGNVKNCISADKKTISMATGSSATVVLNVIFDAAGAYNVTTSVSGAGWSMSAAPTQFNVGLLRATARRELQLPISVALLTSRPASATVTIAKDDGSIKKSISYTLNVRKLLSPELPEELPEERERPTLIDPRPEKVLPVIVGSSGDAGDIDVDRLKGKITVGRDAGVDVARVDVGRLAGKIGLD